MDSIKKYSDTISSICILLASVLLFLSPSIPTVIFILLLCGIAFISLVSSLFKMAGRIRKDSPDEITIYIMLFAFFYFVIIYLFALSYYAASKAEHYIFYAGQKITDFPDLFYHSVAVSTSLGYGQPSDFFTKVISVIEVSFGVIFISTVLSVVLSLRKCSFGGCAYRSNSTDFFNED